MRLFTLLLTCSFSIGVLSLSAQNCCAKKQALCKTTSLQTLDNEAMTAALADESVYLVDNEVAGDQKYVRKLTCPTTGEVKFQNVIYSSKSGTFVCDPTNCNPAKCDFSKCKLSKGKTSVVERNGTAKIGKKEKTIIGS